MNLLVPLEDVEVEALLEIDIDHLMTEDVVIEREIEIGTEVPGTEEGTTNSKLSAIH